MISDARGRHVSPGIYTEEKEVTNSVKSLGITSLGLVGETQKGPAFQNIEISDWAEFVDYFGGTSTEKYPANGRPKYELPYIAKSYLEESKRLNVVRVLGLSGYDAGKAWVLYNTKKQPILVLRSKMVYNGESNLCEEINDGAESLVETIKIGEYSAKNYTSLCETTDAPEGYTVETPYRVGIDVTSADGNNYHYNVSLKSTDRDYIYNVLGSSPTEGEALIYIDSLYEKNINGEDTIDGDFVAKDQDNGMKSYYKLSGITEEKNDEGNITGYTYEYVKEATNPSNDDKYEQFDGALKATVSAENYNKADYPAFIFKTGGADNNEYWTSFKEAFRAAQTPWIVSNATATDGDNGKKATMKKLFKIWTISDGNAANYQVKISIQNIRPDEGTFDVVVRDFYDNDNSPLVLEKFTKCTLVEGESSFIGYKIGTYDGSYANKSKYITIEMADNENLASCVPAGFLGYPSLFGKDLKINYNKEYNTGIKAKRQYFGLNSFVIDSDILNYQGKYAYSEGDYNYEKLTNGFHLDSLLDDGGGDVGTYGYGADNIYVDGVSGYAFTTVSPEKTSASEKYIPRIINGSYMDDCLYKDVNTRKFTVYPYGGFDGWDVNRGYRSNGDKFKASQYAVKSGNSDSESKVFQLVSNTGYGEMLNLGAEAITSDYYAYLGGYKQFANPEDVDINLFATPGIDWFNNTLLSEDALDMIEDKEDGRGGDALYIMTTPQYSDNGERYTPSEIASNLEYVQLDSSYACTYFPWVKYFDTTANKYIDLPVTKDVVRNMAKTDNSSYPWFTPAGLSRGPVSCLNAVKKTTLDDEDTLYENRINPVKSFSKDGVKIWGNKTLYDNEDSPLNRINVRRLMIRIKKLIVEASRALIFEQYDETLEKQFRSIVEPILKDVQSNRGITDFKVITEVTAETMDQHILPAVIKVKPTPALEYISISFVVYPQSVEFDENE